MSNPYKNLASAIVLQAIDDTIRAIQGRNPIGYYNKTNNYEHIIQENYKFFRSTWFACLTDIDGKKLVETFESKREFIKQNKFNKIYKFLEE